MNRDWRFGFTFATFGVMATLAQVWVLPWPIRLAVVAGAAISAMVAWRFFRRARHHEHAVAALTRIVSARKGFLVRAAATEADLQEVWNIDVTSFSDHAVSFETGLAWWRKYRQGVYMLERDGEIVGYISLWPLTRQDFEDFVHGRRLEKEISARNIQPPAGCIETFWYIGSVMLKVRWRKTVAARLLLREATKLWLASMTPDAKLHLCALAYSEDGERLLRRFGFHCLRRAEESSHKLAVFLKSGRLADVKDELAPVMSEEGARVERRH